MRISDEILNFVVDTHAKKGIGDTIVSKIFCLTQYA